ncbi:MAG: DUF488 domain-containing protein [Steroidobacteraceae bacterium]
MILTAGYEGLTLDTFLARLAAHGVRTLADLREAPISRKRGFSKTALALALEQQRIGYRHIRALGCPKPIRDAYRADGDWQKYTRGFMAHLGQQQPAIAELTALVDAQPTALLCYEADFNRCHRTYVARAVAQPHRQVVHITAAGLVMDANPCPPP